MGLIPASLGPFQTKHLLIGGLILGCTYAAMFMLMGFLSFGFVFPIWMFVCFIMTGFVIVAILALTIFGYMRWGPEGFLFARSRREGIPIQIDAELGSSNADFIIMEKDNPKDVVLKDTMCGTKVDPAMLDSFCKPLSFPFGLSIYINTYYNFMSQSLQNHAAFATIERDFMQNPARDILRFLSMKEYSELLSCPEHYLERNALIKLNKYFTMRETKGTTAEQQAGDKKVALIHVRRYNDWVADFDKSDNPVVIAGHEPYALDINDKVTQTKHWGLVEEDITLSTMLDAIYKARHDVNQMPVAAGLIAGVEAFKNNSVAYSSQHLSHVLMLYREKIEEMMENRDAWMTKGIIICAILIAGGVAVYFGSLGYNMIHTTCPVVK